MFIAPHSSSQQSKQSRGAALRTILQSNSLSFVMEAHNGISAKIAAEAGFEAIWASGLSMSAALGLRDRNEASWTQIVDLAEIISEGVDIPVLLDGDTGFGDFNNVRRLVKKLCERGIAGVCLEDKKFPKQNSFLSENQTLAPIQEFCGKIRAAKDSQIDPSFVVVARIEALVAGCGLDEALQRADAYSEAGADAILIHSRKSTADEILEFCRRWDRRCPIVIVPTKYFNTPTQAFADANISAVIWANHSLRASVKAMTELTSRLMRDRSLIGIEDTVASVDEIFRLTNEAEVDAAERIYT